MGKALWTTALGAGVLVAIAGTVYAWGAGWFWPCETLGRPFSGGVCERIAHLEDRGVGTFALLANGNLLLATRGKGEAPADPLALVEIDASTGATITDAPLATIPPQATPGRMAISPDQSKVALSLLPEPTRVVARDGQELASIPRWLPAYLAFDRDGMLLLDMGHNLNGLPNPDTAEVWDWSTSTQEPLALSAGDTSSLFQAGVNAAISPDGEMFAHPMGHLRDSPAMGLRLGRVDRQSEPGTLLGAVLSAGCGYVSGDISFSPFGSQVAAEFNCPDRWGAVTSALVVWDYAQSKTLLTLPSVDYFDTLLWQDASTLLVDRYNYNDTTTDILRIKVPAADD